MVTCSLNINTNGFIKNQFLQLFNTLKEYEMKLNLTEAKNQPAKLCGLRGSKENLRGSK